MCTCLCIYMCLFFFACMLLWVCVFVCCVYVCMDMNCVDDVRKLTHTNTYIHTRIHTSTHIHIYRDTLSHTYLHTYWLIKQYHKYIVSWANMTLMTFLTSQLLQVILQHDPIPPPKCLSYSGHISVSFHWSPSLCSHEFPWRLLQTLKMEITPDCRGKNFMHKWWKSSLLDVRFFGLLVV